MQTLVTIGEFSRLSHLTAKALRHYHDVGLLTPIQIDQSGYRRYGVAQVQQAQLVRRLRLLDMPVGDIKAMLAADTEAARDAAIAAHLLRMEESLGRTSEVVASLRALLKPTDSLIGVEYRVIGETPAVGIRAQVHRADVADWCGKAFPLIYAAVAGAGTDPAGPGGATYDARFFEQDIGEVIIFVPVAQPTEAQSSKDFPGDPDGRVESIVLPPGRFAVAVHAGGFDEIDRSYGLLGSQVAEYDDPIPQPIREHYLVGPDRTQQPDDYRTEIWWPISRRRPPSARPAPTRPAPAHTPPHDKLDQKET